MHEHPRDPAPDRQETVERREVVHRTGGADPVPPRGTGPGLNWLLLAVLMLVVLALVWFIFTRGQPQQPLDNVQVDVPTVETPTVREERRIEIRTPAADDEAPAPVEPQGDP